MEQLLLDPLVLQLPRGIAMAISIYALGLVLFRWTATRVLSQDRRFLLLFFVMELGTNVISGLIKARNGVAVDISTWLTVPMQMFLTAYLHYSIPSEYRTFGRRIDVWKARRRA
jgi:hypothetical protein